METPTVTTQAIVDADQQKAWDYYTQPEHITQWNFASDDWHCPSASNDLRVGGTYIARMEAKDGSFGFDFGAVYDEIVPGEKIVYTIGDGRKVYVNIDPTENKTQVTVTFEAEATNPVEMQRSGWQAILDNYKKYTETN